MKEIKLTEQQLEIIETNADKVVVIASAGTSKTTVMIERIKYLVRGGADPSKIVAITFTRNAAQEIISRLGDIQIFFCGTIHAFANYLLLCGGHDTKEQIQEENFDALIEELTKYPECIKTDITNLFLDEAQDSNQIQLDFIFEMLKPQRWMLMGDPKQSIYQFNGAQPELICELSEQLGVTTYYMTENFRNSRNIHKYAKTMLEYSKANMIDASKPKRENRGQVIKFEYDLDYLSEIVKQIGKFGEWFVLAYTNKEVGTIMDYFTLKGIPCDTFKQGELTNAEIKDRMNQNTVKVLTCHSSKGLESKNVAVLRFVQTDKEKDRLYYVACTRAKDTLVIMNRKKSEKKKQYRSWE